jgi:hypothetical protein
MQKLVASVLVQAAALNLFSQLESSEAGGGGGSQAGSQLDADIREAVYQAAARTDDWEVYQQVGGDCAVGLVHADAPHRQGGGCPPSRCSVLALPIIHVHVNSSIALCCACGRTAAARHVPQRQRGG